MVEAQRMRSWFLLLVPASFKFMAPLINMADLTNDLQEHEHIVKQYL